MRTFVIFETLDTLIINHDNQEILDEAIKNICQANDWNKCYVKQIRMKERTEPIKKAKKIKICLSCGMQFESHQERKVYCNQCIMTQRYQRKKGFRSNNNAE